MESMEFTEHDLRLIKAMCITAYPGFPERPMIPAFQSVYDKADSMLKRNQERIDHE